jgi:Zn-dependent peptidase ImmA (M78 family)
MQFFNPGRLKSARLLAGLSLREVEEALHFKVTYSSINKYEKGLMKPDNGTLLLLAEILKVTPAYFLEQNIVELGEISFRKKSTMTATEVAMIKEKTKDKVERYIEAERLLDVSPKFFNPIAGKQIKVAARAEELADIVRKEWCLGMDPISNVIEMLEEHGVKVIEINAPGKFDGLCTFVDNGIPVVVINDSFTIERKRFTALHELGHLMMRINADDHRETEGACHRFAGAILLPATVLKKAIGEQRSKLSLGELISLKEEYGISVQATMRRALDLGIVSPVVYQQFFKSIAGNKKETGMGSYKGEEKSHRLLQMVCRLASEKIITMDKAASLAGMDLSDFNAFYHNVPVGEDINFYSLSEASFANAWAEDEAQYSFDDVKTINPEYAGK